MNRDRATLWTIIILLTLLIVAQLVGTGMLNHWQAQSDELSKPNPLYFNLGGH